MFGVCSFHPDSNGPNPEVQSSVSGAEAVAVAVTEMAAAPGEQAVDLRTQALMEAEAVLDHEKGELEALRAEGIFFKK